MSPPVSPPITRRLALVAPDVLALLGLALAALAILWPLGLTNRILGGIDAFTYFTPYWDYRMAAFRSGAVPLWNPYLFTGAPFLANIQAAVLYPLHWPLSWLSAERALVWSAILHCWLAASFTYTFARRSLRVSRSAAFLAGLLFGLSGFALARVENINQLNGLAWLPALLWLHDETARGRGRSRVLGFIALAVVIALQLLAGHTQTTFINMVGWALYAASHLIVEGRSLRSGPRAKVIWHRHWLAHVLPFLALVPAVLLSAAQLLPTLELNDLGLRTGGLSYREAVSFSLRPRLLLQTFLPPFAGGLAEAFGSEGFGEFIGYVGIAGLLLAAIGAASPSRFLSRFPQGDLPPHGAGDPRPSFYGRTAALALTLGGAFLALGAYNPVYYVLWRLAPGFDLFRAPARWLVLFALGAALLAALGLDRLGPAVQRPSQPQRRSVRIAPALAVLALTGLLAWQQWPSWRTVGGWVIAGTLAAVLARWRPALYGSGRRAALIVLTVTELFLASRALPFTAATAPIAAGLRNAPASLLAATTGQPGAGRDRFLSLSDIRYDPGDLDDLRALQSDRLASPAVERLVRAAKQVEVLAPNLPLYFRLPAVDGYDGGLLPLQRYVQLQGLFLPPDTLLPDGRLREQLAQVPPDRLLDLTGVRFVITDKQHDLWAGDVYYDLELPARLDPRAELVLDLSTHPRFPATAAGIVLQAEGTAGDPAAELLLVDATGSTHTLDLRAGRGISVAADPSATPAVLPIASAPAILRTITVRNTGSTVLLLRGMSLINAETGAHTSVTVSPRGDFRRIHSGDVKLYERRSSTGRAWLVHGVVPVQEGEAAAVLADPGFDPAMTAVLEAPVAPQPPGAMAAGESASIRSYSAERVELAVTAGDPAVLILADAWYPGWEATVDGEAATVLHANLLFRGLQLAPGEHTVVFTFHSRPWELGRLISLAALAALALGTAWALVSPGRGNRI